MPIFNLHHQSCSVSSDASSYSTMLHRSLLIDVMSRLTTADDIDDNLLVFTQYGQSVRRLLAAFNSARTNIHFWDSTCDTPEFKKHICIGAHVDFATHGQIEMMVNNTGMSSTKLV